MYSQTTFSIQGERVRENGKPLGCSFGQSTEALEPGYREFVDAQWEAKCEFPSRAEERVPFVEGSTYDLAIDDGREGTAEYVREEVQPLARSAAPDDFKPRYLIFKGRSPLVRKV